MKIKAIITSIALLASMSFTAPVVQAADDTLYVPIPSYRVGPYAVGGTGYFGGILDYYNLLNMRCLLYTSPSPRDKRQSRMPSSA